MRLADEIDQETKRIARRHGCDLAVFTVCWGEVEKGLKCKCKSEAALIVRSRRAAAKRACIKEG